MLGYPDVWSVRWSELVRATLRKMFRDSGKNRERQAVRAKLREPLTSAILVDVYRKIF
jgi:hypothetical protein